jgi:hypothetical protein
LQRWERLLQLETNFFSKRLLQTIYGGLN